jgi:hypothetical protein
VIDLFERAKLVGLLGFPDLLDIVWREKERFPGSISYLHQQGPISFRKLMGGCLLERQRSVLLVSKWSWSAIPLFWLTGRLVVTMLDEHPLNNA